MSEAGDFEPETGMCVSSSEFSFAAASDEERFRRYCELRDERYRKLVKSLEKQVRVLEGGIRWVDEEAARMNSGSS